VDTGCCLREGQNSDELVELFKKAAEDTVIKVSVLGLISLKRVNFSMNGQIKIVTCATCLRQRVMKSIVCRYLGVALFLPGRQSIA
jgi:hypothetical protein